MASAAHAHLTGLNVAQLRAVQADPQGALQILAGPGSGKTKTLTSRVAHLVTVHGVPARQIIVNTFTNKAANEMKHRLRATVGDNIAGELIMGTFHAMCVRFLRRHGRLIGLREGWSIADEGDNQALVKRLIADRKGAFEAASCEPPKPAQIRDIICKAKAKDISPAEHAENCIEDFAVLCSQIYDAYQTALEADNALDFDDLLLKGLKLFREHPRVVSEIKHVFIDEFQDTNSVQYMITKCLAAASNAITIVGDPDQSIYGWRSAEVENLHLMRKDFPHTQSIYLEQNYRSTGAILKAALAVVEQDADRVKKSLFTAHPSGLPVVLRACNSAPQEADFIASEIKRLVAQSGGMLDLNDFAILLRFNALSRLLEAALQKAGLPCRLVGGHRFFERVEVRDLLAYLNLADNPMSTAAFRRVINVPKRGIGNKTVESIVEAAASRNISPFDVVSKAVKGQTIGGIKPAQRKALKPFVECVAQVRIMASEGSSVPDLIEHIVQAIEYRGHLERTYPTDYDTRMENVKELSAFAQQVADEHPNGLPELMSEAVDEEMIAERLDSGEAEPEADLDEEPASPASDNDNGFEKLMNQLSKTQSQQSVAPVANPLRTFLEASMLSTDTEMEDAKDDKAKPKVTISTCHAAKGLEWPVVFVPAVEQGTFPFYRSESEAEERRLLYVAMTRAKTSLCLSHCRARMRGAEVKDQKLSTFVSTLTTQEPKVFAGQSEALTQASRALMAKVIGRTPVDEAIVAQKVAEWRKTAPQDFSPLNDSEPNIQRSSWAGYSTSGPSGFRSGSGQNWNQKSQSSLPPVNAGFTKAGSGMPAVSGYNNKPYRPPTQKMPSTGLNADVLTTETRQSKIGSGLLVGKQEPIPAANLDRWQRASNDSLADIKSLLPPAESSMIPAKRETPAASGSKTKKRKT